MTRNEAAAAGLTRYNTGRPCRNGHTADRYTSTGNCCECLKSHSREFAAVLRASKQPTEQGGRLFAYRLHADDHAAALAYCQALDLQRGRTPSPGQAVAVDAPPAQPSANLVLPEHIQRHRAELERAYAPAPGPGYLPAEFARHTEPSDER